MMNSHQLRQRAELYREMATEGQDMHLMFSLRQLADEFDAEASAAVAGEQSSVAMSRTTWNVLSRRWLSSLKRRHRNWQAAGALDHPGDARLCLPRLIHIRHNWRTGMSANATVTCIYTDVTMV